MSLLRPACLATAVLGLALAAPASAPAKPSSGIKIVSPTDRTNVRAGRGVSFRLRVKAKGTVFVTVSTSSKKGKNGTIRNDAAVGVARKHGSLRIYRAKLYDYPEFWLNKPRTYYWQAYRIVPSNGKAVRRAGPVVRLRVRR